MAKTLKVITSRCPQNHLCPSIRICPVGALSQTGFSAPQVDAEKCIACGKCADFTPMGEPVLESTAKRIRLSDGRVFCSLPAKA